MREGENLQSNRLNQNCAELCSYTPDLANWTPQVRQFELIELLPESRSQC